MSSVFGVGGNRPLRIAIAGVGKIARDQHIPALIADPAFALVAAMTLEGGVDGLPVHRSIDALLRGGHALDAIAICTPPTDRGAIAVAAIDAGVAVMLEKPPAATLSEIALIAAHAAARGVTLFAAWHSREAAGVDAARAWLADRAIDRVAVFWREDIRRWHPGQDWILAEGGFGVFDPGINALSIVTRILPQSLIVERAEIYVPKARQAPISANAVMRSGQIPVTINLDFLHQGEQQWDIDVSAAGDTLKLRQGGRIIEVDGRVTEGANDEYPRLYRKFHALVTSGQSDVDVAPLRLVADILRVAVRRDAPEFEW